MPPLDLSHWSRVQLLNGLGVIAGGGLPAVCLAVLNLICHFLSPIASTLYMAAALLFCVVSGIITYLADDHEKRIFAARAKGKPQEILNELERGLNRWLLWGAMLSLIFLQAFVLLTGGPLASPFAFHYLYIPVVVGLCLGKTELKQASVACAVLLVITLLMTFEGWPMPAPDSFPGSGLVRWWLTVNLELSRAAGAMDRNVGYLLIFMFIFMIQLFVTYLTARHTLDGNLREPPAVRPQARSRRGVTVTK